MINDIKKFKYIEHSRVLYGFRYWEKTICLFSKELENSKTIIWNGPMGVFEMSNFENGTKKIGEKLFVSLL